MTIALPAVTMTTDGASSGNPGPGGWAALREFGDRERLLSGPGSNACITNQAELQAVIAGFRALKKPAARRFAVGAGWDRSAAPGVAAG